MGSLVLLRCLRPRFLAALVGLTSAAVSHRGFADEGAWLRVSITPEASSCPDTERLRTQVEALLDEVPQGLEVQVGFRFERGTYAVEITRSGSTHVRVLSDTGDDCEPLGKATATSIALLIETAAPESAPPPPAPILEKEAPAAPDESKGAKLRIGAAARTGLSVGATTTQAPMIAGQFTLGWRGVSTRLGAMHVVSHRDDLGPGFVRQDLWAATVTACIDPIHDRSWSLFACSGIFSGILSAQAEGFTENGAQTRPWNAVPLMLAGGPRLIRGDSVSVRLLLGATGLVVPARETLGVMGLPDSVRTSRFPVTVWSGLAVDWHADKLDR